MNDCGAEEGPGLEMQLHLPVRMYFLTIRADGDLVVLADGALDVDEHLHRRPAPLGRRESSPFCGIPLKRLFALGCARHRAGESGFRSPAGPACRSRDDPRAAAPAAAAEDDGEDDGDDDREGDAAPDRERARRRLARAGSADALRAHGRRCVPRLPAASAVWLSYRSASAGRVAGASDSPVDARTKNPMRRRKAVRASSGIVR